MSALAELEPALDAVEVVSPTAVRLAGVPYERPAANPAQAAAAEGGAVVIPLLADLLYAHAYVRRVGAAPAAPPVAGPDDLIPALSAAHPGRERWEDGWTVRQALSTGRVVAERAGDARFLWPGEYVAADGPGMPPSRGMRLRLWRPRESPTLQPGFWFAFGSAGGSEELPLVRIYWNFAADAAPSVVAALLGPLDRYGLPYRFKCLSSRALYPRTDCAVLYVARRHWSLAAELALAARERVAGGMGDDTPLFARALAPGLAFAEDPGSGESFGMHRCRLLAEGIWSAWRAGTKAPAERLGAVAEAFRRGGVDPDRPWLSAGSTGRYEVPDAA
ncbi:hypothetical protein SAMN05216486_10327 [bacterium JGI 053]|nr:hypothetical protein SAMN05216486_10327 [bacterium JGI 053]